MLTKTNVVKKQIQLLFLFLFILTNALFAQESIDLQKEVEVKTTMLVIITLVFIIGLIVAYYVSKKYLPSDMMQKARMANVDITDFGVLKLRAKGEFDIEKILEELIRAKIADVDIKLSDVKDVINGVGGVNLGIIIDNLIIANKAGLDDVNIQDLYRHSLINHNVSDFVKAKIKIRNGKLEEMITNEILEDHLMAGGDMIAFVDNISKAKKSGVKVDMEGLMKANLDKEGMEKIVSTLIRAKKANVYIANDEIESDADAFHNNKISQNGLLQIYSDDKNVENYLEAIIKAHKFGIDNLLLSDLFEFALTKDANVLEIVNALVKAKRGNLDMTLNDIMVFSLNQGDVNNFVEAYLISKSSNLDLSISDLEQHQLSGGNVLNYVKALKIAKNPDFGISKKEIEELSLKGGNVLSCSLAILRARELNVELDWNNSSQITLAGINPVEVILACVNPKVIHVTPFKVVGKDGIVLRIHASVAVKLKIKKYFNGSGDQTLFERVSEAIIHEVGKYPDNKTIVKSLGEISQHALHHLQEQTETNNHSKYHLEDITIPEIETLEDIYAELKKEHAHIEAIATKTTAEAELLAAEAKVENAFAEAIKTGQVNDYFKHKIYKEKQSTADTTQQDTQKKDSHGDANAKNSGDAHH